MAETASFLALASPVCHAEVTSLLGVQASRGVPPLRVTSAPWMREAPPLCAHRMAAWGAGAAEEPPDEDDDDVEEEVLVDDEVLDDDDELLRG